MPLENSLFGPIFAVVVVLIALGFVFVIVSIVRNARKAKQHGLDPMTMQADLTAKVMQSDLFANGQSKAQRLAEVDAMLANGVITSDEHTDARAAILRD